MFRISPVVSFLTKCALFSAVLLLVSNVRTTSSVVHTWLGALALALVGIAYAVLQIQQKPDRLTLAKRLLLAGTFVLWAISQFLPSGRLATLAGDLVVSAYVVDLFWIIEEQRGAGS